MRTIRFGEAAQFVNGRAFKPSDWESDGLPIIRIQNLTGSTNVINHFSGDVQERYLVKDGDILISWSASLGVYLWDKGDAILNQHIFKVNLNPGIDTLFFYYAAQGVLDAMKSEVHGTTMQHITKDRFEALEIPLPPVAEQKRIAAVLNTADRLRRLRRYALEISEGYLQSVFLMMFGDPVTNPMGWETATAGDLGKVQTGNTPSRKIVENYGDSIEWIKSNNIVEGRTWLTQSQEMLSEMGVLNGRIAEAGSILVTCIAGSVSSIGNVALADRTVAFNQQINSVTPNADVNPLFLYGLFLFAKSLVQETATSSMKRIITKSKFENLQLFKPPITLQNQFAEVFVRQERLRVQQFEAIRQADHLFDTLLHRAFQGEL